MSKWIIDKTFEGSYGHRVWVQRLQEEFSLTNTCKCLALHGHNYTIKVYLESETLQSGMVTDFNHLSWLKRFLDDYVDHKFILDQHDPLYSRFVGGSFGLVPVFISGVLKPVGYTLDLGDDTARYPTDDPARCVIEGADREWYESFFIVDFVPTSENLSKWIFDFASEKMKSLGNVVRVDWHETPKSRASYIGE